MDPRIGQILRSARVAAGKTQLDLAHALKMTPANYVRLEDGRRVAGLEDVKRFAEAIGVEPVELARRAFEAIEERKPAKTSPANAERRRKR